MYAYNCKWILFQFEIYWTPVTKVVAISIFVWASAFLSLPLSSIFQPRQIIHGNHFGIRANRIAERKKLNSKMNCDSSYVHITNVAQQMAFKLQWRRLFSVFAFSFHIVSTLTRIWFKLNFTKADRTHVQSLSLLTIRSHSQFRARLRICTYVSYRAVYSFFFRSFFSSKAPRNYQSLFSEMIDGIHWAII